MTFKHEDEDSPLRIRCLQVTPRARVRDGDDGGHFVDLLQNRRRRGLGDGSTSEGSSSLAIRPSLQHQPGHKHSVTAVQWYPMDTGLFISGSTDGSVRVWDTNTFTSAGIFDLGSKVL